MSNGYTVAELAEWIGAEVRGDATTRVTGLGTLASAVPGQLAFLAAPAYRAHLAATRASAVVLAPPDAAGCPVTCIVTGDPKHGFARLSHLFDDRRVPAPGVHASAIVDASADLDDGVSIGPFAVIGARCRVHDGAVIGSHCAIGDDCEVGPASELHANVVLYRRVRIGARCVVHSGAVLGGDGFGFAPGTGGRYDAVAQVGGVSIGDDVSIGASTTIDRGAIEDTVIGTGVKIDNQVQIGHNCVVGDHSLLCGCVGLVGSTRIGRHCILAGMVGVGGNSGPIEIADGVVVTGMTHVSRSISEPGVYSGGVLHSRTRRWKRNALRFSELDVLAKRIAQLEKKS